MAERCAQKIVLTPIFDHPVYKLGTASALPVYRGIDRLDDSKIPQEKSFSLVCQSRAYDLSRLKLLLLN